MFARTSADTKHSQKSADGNRPNAVRHGTRERPAHALGARSLRASMIPIAPVDAAEEREAVAFADRGVRPPGPDEVNTGPAFAPLTGSHGVPLDPVFRQVFEQGLNADLGPVRIHDDSASHQFARDHGAQAVTLGAQVYFGEHRYAPSTARGRQLLAHELAHTRQQSAQTMLHRTPETEARLLEIENELASSVSTDEARAQLEAERDQLLQAGNEPVSSPSAPVAAPPAVSAGTPSPAGGSAPAAGGGVVAAGMLGSPMLGPTEMTPPWMTPPTGPVSYPPIPGETPLNFTPSPGVPADGVAVGETALEGAEVAGGATETLTVGGTALGEGTLVSGGGVALSEGAGAVGASVLTEGTAIATGSVLAEGTAVLGTTAVAGGAEVVAVTGATAAATGVTTAATAAGISGAIPVIGWVVAGLIVAGIVIYLVTRDPPRQAPGAPGGTAVSEPGTAPAASAPAAGGQAPVQEPGQVTPMVAPASPTSSGPVLASGPLDGARNYDVFDKNGDKITDIDHIEGNTLWEEKSAVNAQDIPDWVDKNITQKFDAYLRARLRIDPFYANASIGFRFQFPLKPDFAAAIWAEIDRLRGEHPDVTIELEIPPER